MANGNGNGKSEAAERDERDRAMVLNHIAAQPAARTIEELHTGYDLARDQVPNAVQIGKERFADHVKALLKAGKIKKVGNAGVDGEGDPAYAAKDPESGKVLTGE